MRIPINDNRSTQGVNDFGPVEGEVAGPGGATMPGGEVTPPQNASDALDQSVAERTGAVGMEQAQQAGTVEQQTIHQTPMAGDPEGGLPVETLESESSGATQKSAKESTKKNSDVNQSDNNFVGGASDELSEAKIQLRHLAADFENFKRQATRREDEARERAVRGVLEDLLPVLDNFERATMAAGSTSDVQSLRTGVEFILQQLKETLKSHGVETIESQGQPFDPARHEALEEVESAQHETGRIIEDVQTGYVYKGRVLRPSRVRVAK